MRILMGFLIRKQDGEWRGLQRSPGWIGRLSWLGFNFGKGGLVEISFGGIGGSQTCGGANPNMH